MWNISLLDLLLLYLKMTLQVMLAIGNFTPYLNLCDFPFFICSNEQQNGS